MNDFVKFITTITTVTLAAFIYTFAEMCDEEEEEKKNN